MKEEPSVLDYVIAILTPWRGAPPPIPPLEPSPDFTVGIEGGDEREGTLAVLAPGATHAQDLFTWIRRLPWVIIAGLILALAGQSSMEPPARDWVQGIFFYSLSAICWVIFLYRDKNVITGDQSV